MKKNRKTMAALLLLCLALAGCKGQTADVTRAEETTAEAETSQTTAEAETSQTTAETETSQTDAPKEAEEKAALTEDYYEAVNGELLAKTELPADSGSWSRFYAMGKETEEKITGILKELAEKRGEAPKGSTEQKIADYYVSALDKDSRAKAGLGNLAAYLEKIRSARTVQEYMETIGEIQRETGYGSLIGIWGMEDMADSNRYAWYLASPDLGPGKETLEDETQGELMEKYRSYIASLMHLGGMEEEEAARTAEEIYAFQKELASVALPRSESINPNRVYNPYTTEELQGLFSNIDVTPYLEKVGVAERGVYIVMEEELEKKINACLTEEKLPVLKNYSVYCLLNDCAGYLSPDIELEQMKWLQAQSGAKEFASEETRAYQRTSAVLGNEIGKLYVERYFSEDDKAAVKEMIGGFIQVYEDRIQKLEWMSGETKAAAVRKLDAMTLKIGYPDVWPDDYQDCEVLPIEENGCLINNHLALMRGLQNVQMKKYSSGKVDKTEWSMTPQTVNAYYNPLANEIVFPAAILQPPFYSPDASKAENLGGIGTVIAHEISHAFDDNGSQYDEAGNYSNWWTEADRAEFEKRAQAVVEYYGGIEVLPGRYVNGEQTLGENIADLAAVSCVSELALREGGAGSLQELYHRYAEIWANKSTEESQINALNKDSHSPAKVRVNAVLRSIDEFYLAYPEIKEGDGMYTAPEKRVKVW